MKKNAFRIKSLRKLILFALGLFPLLLAYCAPPPQTEMPLLQTQTPISPTITQTQFLKTRTPNPPPTNAWTALPTYPADQRREITMNLFENPTCALPCWWGITPGETDWRDAWQFLARFADNWSPDNTLLFESDNLPGYQIFQINLDAPYIPGHEHYSNLNHLLIFIHENSTLVQYIDVNTTGNIDSYTIPQILAMYGQPDQVYVRTQASQRPEKNSVSLYLDYGDHGFISEHFTTVEEGVWKEESFTACFQLYTRLILGPKGKPIGPEIIAALYPQPQYHPQAPYQPIEDISNMNTTEFFETFTGSSDQICIKLITANLEK